MRATRGGLQMQSWTVTWAHYDRRHENTCHPFSPPADDARITAARTDVGNLMQALKLYKLDNQRFPTGAQGLGALTLKPTTEPVPGNWKPYLDKLPNDPWGRPYQYMNPGIKGEVDVLSFGADGQAGGEGNNADIGSWQ
jgi:general secretion pathway protein G